ncbi:MAG: hypothetical protein P0S96_08105 [Simkaniaceae bacterium]|nr:hypothetical protein [Candidatus Sacchlamyda saccharinae]
MSILHVCNTFFEWELAGLAGNDLASALTINPIMAQLQFLPYVYGNETDSVLATDKPDEMTIPTYTLDERPPFSKIETWGASKLVQEWALSHDLLYQMPPFDVVKMVNSKTYSFAKSPLPGAKLIYKGDRLEPKMILKSCYGTAGRGLIASDSPKAKGFCENQWQRELPVIAEPWVERSLDFSTQWIISPSGEIAYLGSTICKTTEKGAHIGNIAGGPPPTFVEEQKAAAMPILEEMAIMGFFGNVGFDAMIYGNNQLQPVVEINARKTMGWVTLQVQQKKYPGQHIELAYIPSNEKGILPLHLKNTILPRQIHLAIL